MASPHFKKLVWTGEEGILRHPLFNTIIGSGLLSLVVFLLTSQITNNEMAADKFKLEIEQKEQLHTKLIDEGEKWISVFVGYKESDIYIRTPTTNKFFGNIGKDQMIQNSMQIYSIYIQTPSLDGVLEQIRNNCPNDPTLTIKISRLALDLEKLKKSLTTAAVESNADVADKDLQSLAASMQVLINNARSRM